MKFLYACLVLIGVLGLSLSKYSDNNDVVDKPISIEQGESSRTSEDESSLDTSHQEDNKTGASFPILGKDEYTVEDTANDNQPEKRYGFVLGRGFGFGKRYGNILGHGMSFGKRFGSVLGKGMTFGKRFGTVLGHGMSFGKRYGSVLGKGFAFGKRDSEVYENEDNNKGNKGFIPDIYNDKTENKRNNDDNIDEDMEFVDLSGPVDEKKWVLNDIYGGEFPNYKRSKRDTRVKRFARFFGNVLGRGFSIGKKDEMPGTNSMSGELGMQASVNNIPFEDEDDTKGEVELEKRFISGLEGHGYISGKRQSYHGRGQRQSFGNVLGRGFSFGKRDSEMDDEPIKLNTNYAFSGINNENSLDDAVDQLHDKRYFHSSPGHRFLFGKRDMEDRDKRFGFVLGRGYSFGKRGDLHPKKRYPYGLVLGRGFSFGKRSSETEDGMPNIDGPYTFPDLEYDPQSNKRASFVLGRGYMFGKRGAKRFGWVLGNGLSFGKRDSAEQHYPDPDDVSQFIDDFGNIFIRTDLIEDFDKLNSEYLQKSEQRIFGCAGSLIQHHADSNSELDKSYTVAAGLEDLKKRSAQHVVNYFVDDLGHVFVNAEDISSKDNPLIGEDKDISYYTCDGQVTQLLGDSDIYDNVSKRGWGSVLGRGFRFGKRFGSRKRFGHILGNGFAFGK
ncbi:uncharacterized protein LOC123535358 [Mercenaria mercenaria]|uniref:uncharacterized protein LOC123535358 n=1 Tax=Mercenaria mercenaria TaxID=6596 RepID=UPI00234E5C7A|nr:uncharacterized protein LOC123535358 [Mercenaria mercenaria]